MKTTRTAGSALTVALAAATAWAPAGLDAQTETVRLEGDRVAVWNLAGRVQVVPGDGPDVVVRVDRGGDDGSRLELATGEMDGRASLRVVYPSDRVVYDGGDFSGNVSVRVRDDGTFDGGGGDRVRVSSSGRGLEAWADLRIEVPAGRDVEVYLAAGRMEASDVRGDLRLDTGSGPVDVRGLTGRTVVDTGSGSVTAREVEGDLDVDTGSGSVHLEDVRAERVVVDTGSGDVTGSGIAAAQVVVDTGSGRVEVTGLASGDVRIDTGSGAVEVELLRDVDRLQVDTGSGGVTVWLTEAVGAELELDSGSGGIELDFPVEVRTMERDHVEGRIGDGRGLIEIDTGSGAIRLRRR